MPRNAKKKFHVWTDSDYPNGWDNQIEDEFFANLFFERKLKFLNNDLYRNFAWDMIPHVGCSFGNAFISANFGSQVRCGWHLPNDFGTYQIRPGSQPDKTNHDQRCPNQRPNI